MLARVPANMRTKLHKGEAALHELPSHSQSMQDSYKAVGDYLCLKFAEMVQDEKDWERVSDDDDPVQVCRFFRNVGQRRGPIGSVVVRSKLIQLRSCAQCIVDLVFMGLGLREGEDPKQGGVFSL